MTTTTSTRLRYDAFDPAEDQSNKALAFARIADLAHAWLQGDAASPLMARIAAITGCTTCGGAGAYEVRHHGVFRRCDECNPIIP